jgi:hypothetical protein
LGDEVLLLFLDHGDSRFDLHIVIFQYPYFLFELDVLGVEALEVLNRFFGDKPSVSA